MDRVNKIGTGLLTNVWVFRLGAKLFAEHQRGKY